MTDDSRPKIVALEEHLMTSELAQAWSRLPKDEQEPMQSLDSPEIERRLRDLEAERIACRAEGGVDVQVLSPTAPGGQNRDAGLATSMARELNDLTAEQVRRRPDRFQGFAILPTPDPAAAPRELERSVRELGLKGGFLFGRTGERNLDHPDFLPIFEAAAALRAPLYLHPQSPAPAVRKACYSGFGDVLDMVFAGSGIGWHYETGLQLLRLILSGVFDCFPNLQIVTLHWGEVVLFYLERTAAMDRPAKLKRSIPDYVREHVSVTPSGMFSQRYLRWSVEVLGVDRIMFSTDYPYQFAPGGGARAFLEAAELTPQDRAKIAHGNWDRLTSGLRV